MSLNVLQAPIIGGIAGTVATLTDIATAPKSATRTSALRGSIAFAFVLLLGLAYLGTLLERAETEHVIGVAIAKQLAAHSSRADAHLQTAQQLAATYARVVPVIGLLLLTVQQFAAAGIITLTVALLDGRLSYRNSLYIVVHVSVLTIGIAQLALGFIHFMRGPGEYDTTLSMQLGMPSVAWLVNAPPPAEVVLAAFNPFTLWQLAILTLWIAHAARLSTARALVAALVPLALCTGLAAMYAGG